MVIDKGSSLDERTIRLSLRILYILSTVRRHVRGA